MALTLSRNGMDVVQSLGIPEGGAPEADAVVISLKTRTAPASTASELSAAAARYLLDHGAAQIVFKYCSTFDSSDSGNIGPVAETLLGLLGSDFTIFCPAFPENGRTVRDGHLFVHGVPLSETSMRDHPLTPMTDSNLVHVLERQTREGAVGLVPLAVVEEGSDAVRKQYATLRDRGIRFAIVDAVTDDHLRTIAAASAHLSLVTGSSGVSMGLPENFRRDGRLDARNEQRTLPELAGGIGIIAGSCSARTREQIDAARASFPILTVDPLALARHASHLALLKQSALDAVESTGSVLLASSAGPGDVRDAQTELGAGPASELVEHALSSLAAELVASGVTKLIVAGGETSGAVAKILGIRELRIGPEIDPGVPWTIRVEEPHMLLAFKSGNFGSRDFFRKAVEMIQ